MSEEDRRRIMRRAQADITALMPKVQPILDMVRDEGDAALVRLTHEFDGVELDISDIQVTQEEIDAARNLLSEDVRRALEFCIGNVKRFHEAQMERVEREWRIEVMPGVWAGERVTPVASVGLYVPRGKAAYPSSLYMQAIPSRLAGVEQIAVVTPPASDGSVDPAYLYAAHICGVDQIYKAGGAQAIAALAYGTETIPRVAKVTGPCSPYGAAAKMALAHLLDPGMPAGPSESIVLCDGTEGVHDTVLDLMNEMEHGSDSAALLVTHDKEFSEKIAADLAVCVADLPSPQREYCRDVLQNYGGIIVTENIDQSIDFINDYAPEHLHIKTADPEKHVQQIQNAGEILIGAWTPSSLGNFGLGVNHVLPTGGMAKSYSCTSVWDYLKRISLAKANKEGFDTLKDPVADMARYEQLPAHEWAVTRRRGEDR